VPAPASPARRIAVAVLLLAMLAGYSITAAPTLISAVHSLAGASPTWLLTGLAATVGSMIAFAALRGRTLAVAGARIPLRRTVAISYGAGAVHTTLPAGAVFSTTYAFRHLRALGASTPATTWSMAITGLLSSVTLSAIGLLGLGLTAGTGGSMTLPIAELAGGAAAILALVHTARHPARVLHLAVAALARINRWRRLPAHTGAARLSQTVHDLELIRPSGRDWTVAAAWALANWALDLACLAACCAAVGVSVGLPTLLITYTAGMAASSLLPLPAGLGAVEATMTLTLTVAGVAASPALAAVLLYRILSTGSVVILGWTVVAAQRVHPDTTTEPTPQQNRKRKR
jgi:uncharacterized membrane protein YbhN (UPF0104 family)